MIPYCPQDSPEPRGKNLAYAYRECMARLRDDDWAVFIDHDVHMLTPHWYPLLERAVAKEPLAGAFYCWQQAGIWPQANPACPSLEAPLREHTAFAERLVAVNKDSLTDLTIEADTGLVGFFFCISKRVWDASGLYDPVNWIARDDLCIPGVQPGHKALAWNDLFITKRLLSLGFRVYRLDGLYVYHCSFYPTSEPPFRENYVVKYEKDYAKELV